MLKCLQSANSVCNKPNLLSVNAHMNSSYAYTAGLSTNQNLYMCSISIQFPGCLKFEWQEEQ